MSVVIQFRRGTDAQRQSVVLRDGEPAFCLDTRKFYIGDGSTPGGIEIQGAGGGGSYVLPGATEAALGGVILTTPPDVVGQPVAVGDNDPRMTDARSPLAHSHVELEPHDTLIQQHIHDTTGNPHNLTPAKIGAQPALTFTPEDASKKNANNGYAGLDANGKIYPNALPSLAITDTFVVADQASMLALTCDVGDIAVRSDLTKSFILKTAPASVLANWVELLSPAGGGGGAVSSVNSKTGAVVLSYTDVGAEASGAAAGAIVAHNAAFDHTKLHNAVTAGTGISITAGQQVSVAANTTVQKHLTSKAGGTAISRQQINFIEGTNVTLTVADNAGADRVDVTINAAAGGGGGATITRYAAVGTPQTYFVASGTGANATLTGTAFAITAPAGVVVFSASLYISSAQLGSATSLTIDFSNVMNGLNTSMSTVFIPQFQVFADDSSSPSPTYVNKAGVSGNMKSGPGILQLTSLTTGFGYWINLSF